MTQDAPTDSRRPEGVDVRPIGWWGTLLSAAVIITTYVAMYFTYVYIRVGTDDWPPAGIDPPELSRAGLAALALLASAVPVAWAARRAPVGARSGVRLGLVAALLLAGAHLWLLLADWSAHGVAVDGSAYGSLFYVLPGVHLVILGIGVLIAAVLLALSWHDEAAAMLHVGAASLRVYWYSVVLGGVLLLAVVYLLPHVWQEAITP